MNSISFYSTCKLHSYHHPVEATLSPNMITDDQEVEALSPLDRELITFALQ